MEQKNFESQNNTVESKGTAKKFWKAVGTLVLAIGLAVLTVLVLSFNK